MSLNNKYPARFSLKKIVVIIVIVLLFGAGLFYVLRPRPVWYVEDTLASVWARSLRQSAPPFTRIKTWSPKSGIPKGPGICITRTSPYNSGVGAGVICFKSLTETREENGALLLALDPWLVFYKHSGNTVSYTRIAAPGEGTLILPGAEPDALWAWTSQLLQQKMGIFADEQKQWDDRYTLIADDPRFQQNSKNCNWTEALSFLLRDGNSWLYAPFSKVMDLPSYRSGLLTARHFPVPQNWNQYGIQASLLWAIPTGAESKALAAAEAWLKDPQIQSLIAGEFHWIAAHPQGSPANPLYRDAQLAWLSSSVVWQKE
ncbi:hypothetical protein AGMMS50293_16000 [Spirochaetia bacterium]|nr:hypothetical protein AGMMS50293_16000 [Spirochaetia bacterium]